MSKQSVEAPKMGLIQSLSLIIPYISSRLGEQIRTVLPIALYLALFQIVILGLALTQTATLTLGMALVILGLALFMEGLVLGLMPLGEVIGLKLPQKSRLVTILIFAFILGVGATFAEPAIGVLKAAGSAVQAWDAPLLYLLLNQYSHYVVGAVAMGVGLAVVTGMLRFFYNWSIKPLIFCLVITLITFTTWSYFDENMLHLTGLAWDCGAVTTGPVTVPLVLALGLGICRVVGRTDSGVEGFGIVTVASLFPVLAVMITGCIFLPHVPAPMEERTFFHSDKRELVRPLFASEDHFAGYALKNAPPEEKLDFFSGEQGIIDYLSKLSRDPERATRAFGSPSLLEQWVVRHGTRPQQIAVFGSAQKAVRMRRKLNQSDEVRPSWTQSAIRQGQAAFQAIIPLSLFFLLFLYFILREKLPHRDEVFFGLVLALGGFAIFNLGIEWGLVQLGNQVGGKIPSAFTKVSLEDGRQSILKFDPKLTQTAITQEGKKKLFFYIEVDGQFKPVPYNEKMHNPSTRSYTYIPQKGPLYRSWVGVGIILIFAFFLGYGATLAEPALNALGLTVEEVTVGAFPKGTLMQTVALGVGLGIALGVIKIIGQVPLAYFLVPSYILLLILTWISTEDFANIAWDSAGVTTGPITVPLVLALGLGLGTQIKVVEGFGILALASVGPILSVLAMGIYISRRRRPNWEESKS